jgi:hypothetical protein
MSVQAVNGNKFVLIIDGEAINCEANSSLSLSAEQIEVRCKTSGSWATFLDDTIKSGSISFDGIYNKTGTNSAFSIASKLGGVYPFIWGGTEPGDEVLTGNLFLATAEITANLDTAITFSGTGNISGEPNYGVVGT